MVVLLSKRDEKGIVLVFFFFFFCLALASRMSLPPAIQTRSSVDISIISPLIGAYMPE